MHHRRALLLLAIPLLASWFAHPETALSAPEVARATGITVPNLKDTLEKGLKARLPSQFKFIELVVTMVENDQLPLKLVQSTFLWARKKPVRFPFPYFETGLRTRAKRIGIEIPDVN